MNTHRTESCFRVNSWFKFFWGINPDPLHGYVSSPWLSLTLVHLLSPIVLGSFRLLARTLLTRSKPTA
jgi:hypothetical protein